MPQDQYQRTFPLCRVPTIHPTIFYDDCNGTWNWTITSFGASHTAEYDPSAALVGLNGILLQTDGTAPQINDFVGITRTLWLPPNEQLRLQLGFNTLADSPDAYLAMLIHWFTGVTHYLGGIQVRTGNSGVYYASAIVAGTITWTLLTDIDYETLENAWNRLDFSLDLRARIYHRININEQIVPVTELDFPQEADAAGKALQILILLQTLDEAQATAYIDHVLLTPENP